MIGNMKYRWKKDTACWNAVFLLVSLLWIKLKHIGFKTPK